MIVLTENIYKFILTTISCNIIHKQNTFDRNIKMLFYLSNKTLCFNGLKMNANTKKIITVMIVMGALGGRGHVSRRDVISARCLLG